MSDITTTSPLQTGARVSDYIALLKPRVMSLVVFTGLAGMVIAPGFTSMNPLLSITAIFALTIGAGAASAANMWYERDSDAVMKRTANRPLPRGLIAPDDALAFAVILSILAITLMALATNWVAAALLAGANLFYVLVYTIWLKHRTPQNIVIGGAAGAFPPMIGWAAVTGDISLLSVLLFVIIFLWTPPHFWALALFANEDYKRAGIPMLPVTHGEKATKIQMLIYTLILAPVAVAPWALGMTGAIYGISALVLNLLFILSGVRVLKTDTLKPARQMFGYSVFYLFALFLALMLDQFPTL